MEDVIETVDLTRRFSNVIAVDKLNLTVEQGEVLGLLGPNGAGKTTTISMLCTILKPTSGTARVNGFDIVKQATHVRKSIGIVFQEPSIDDRLTGRENLQMHANLYGVAPSEQKSRVDEALKLVELQNRANSILRTYSGGMRRRLEIARGLLHHPKVLFLDEPTVGLDPQTREHIWSYIKELKEKRDVTIILTTHYMEEADLLSDRVAIIDYGKIVALDTPLRLKEGLRGDVITIETKEADRLASLIVKKMNVLKTRISKNSAEFTVQEGRAVLPRIVEAASDANISVDAVFIREPSLEDVFMHFTGRAIRAEVGGELSGEGAVRRRAIS